MIIQIQTNFKLKNKKPKKYFLICSKRKIFESQTDFEDKKVKIKFEIN